MGLNLTPGGRRWVAVEFDRRHVRVVVFRRSRHGCRVDTVASTSVDESVDITDAAAVGAMIAEAVAASKLSGLRAVMNVRRDEVVLRPLALPPGTPDAEVAGMVRYQVGNELPFPAGQAVIDHVATRHYEAGDGAIDAESRAVLVAAVRADVVEFYRHVAAAAGLRLMHLHLRPESIGRCAERCVRREKGESIAVVSVTADQTEIDLFIHGDLAFSRSVPIGMPDPADGAEPRQAAVAAAVREVMLSVQSFQAGHPEDDVHGVLVAGDTGVEDDLIAALGSRMSIPCERFSPGGALGLDARCDASAHVALLGAAMTGGSAAAESYDFLAPKEPAPQRDPRRDKATAAAVAAMAVVAVGIGLGWWRLSGLSTEAARLAGKLQGDREKAALTERLVQRVQAIEAWETESVDWLGHWAQVSTVFPPPTETYIRNFATRDDGVMTFTVRAKTRETIEQLQRTLGAVDGYTVSPVRMAPGGGDPLNLDYVYESPVEVKIDRAIGPALSERAPERPADDGSATLLSERLSRSAGRAGR